MSGYRPAPQAYQYTSDEGAPLDGGSIVYSESGSSTPKAVYSDEAGTVSMGSTLTLTPAGRAPDHFLVGEYRQIVKDADGNQISLRDNVRDQVTGGVTLPDPSDGADGDVVVVSGAGFALETLLRLPDPTGSDGYAVVADGDGFSLQPFPTPESFEIPDGGIVETTIGENFVIGGTRFMSGSGTIPTSASHISTLAVAFPADSFSGTPKVVCSATSVGVTNNVPPDDATISPYSKTSSGFTARAFCGAENNAGAIAIVSAIGFDWMAMGPA